MTGSGTGSLVLDGVFTRDLEEPGRVFVGTAAQVVEQLKPIMDLGPTHAIFDCRTGSHGELVETMERLAGTGPALAKRLLALLERAPQAV